MSHRAVFLDRDSLQATVRVPSCVTEYTEHAHTSPAQIVARLKGATVAITNKVPLRSADLAQLPDLKMIAVAATGYDVIDIPYCRAHHIAVANIRDYAVHTVPEHTFALILALRRNLFAYRADIEAGAWQRAPQFCFITHEISDLNGSTLGIVGEGAIGRGTGTIGRGFGMHVVYADHPARVASDLEFMPLDALIAQADVLSLHCPLTSNTRGLIGAEQLRRMKRTAILINTSRGGLVDEQALVTALDEGWIAGAGFDVLTSEPPSRGHALLEVRRHNFILTPHIAWASSQAMQALADQLVDNIEAWARGEPRNLVT